MQKKQIPRRSHRRRELIIPQAAKRGKRDVGLDEGLFQPKEFYDPVTFDSPDISVVCLVHSCHERYRLLKNVSRAGHIQKSAQR